MQMAGVEEGVEVITAVEVMTGSKGIKNDVRERLGEHHYNAGYVRLNWVG